MDISAKSIYTEADASCSQNLGASQTWVFMFFTPESHSPDFSVVARIVLGIMVLADVSFPEIPLEKKTNKVSSLNFIKPAACT